MKEETKFVTIRIPMDTYTALKNLAVAQNRSLSAQIIHILKKMI